MGIITLTTDFGERDYSAGAVKGALYNEVPEARVVDISHSVSPYDIFQCAYILGRAYPYFPKGSVHIIGVDAERTPLQRQLIMKYDGHYFIGADNGILTFLCNHRPDLTELVEIDNPIPFCPFPTLNVFVPIAGSLLKGKKFKSLGKETENTLKEIVPYGINIPSDQKNMQGSVIYIDHYGNAVTNITRDFFEEIRNGRKFDIYIAGHKFNKIHNSYNDLVDFSTSTPASKEGNAFLLFNHSNHLELAIYRSNMSTIGGASTLMGIHYRDMISVYFK